MNEYAVIFSHSNKVVHILDGELNINGLRIPVRVDISQAAINAIKIKNLNTVMEILYNLMWLRYCVRELEMSFLLIALIDLFIVYPPIFH